MVVKEKDALDLVVEEKEKEKQEEELKKAKENIKSAYPKIISILKRYCDLDEKYYNIIALWIIGTWLHSNFRTYPYLFLNAMKGSGKTRTLKLIASLSRNGKVIVSVSEAVLFRTAKGRTICIDECERIASKDKQALRELLNVAYKHGLGVERAKKIKHLEGEDWKVERFDLFVPVAMANIYGIEDVLSDRCISFILEKSENPAITRLMEDFDTNQDILELNELLGVVGVVFLGDFKKNDIYNGTKLWNLYITRHYTLTTLTTQTTQTTPTKNLTKSEKESTIFDNLFSKIKDTTLNGRALELFFPLFIIAEFCSENILNETILTAEKIIQEKKVEDVLENRDISLIQFIAEHKPIDNFLTQKEILKEFKEYLDLEEEESKWTNTKWLGRALKRLGLIIEKRRLKKGREVRLNYEKAIKKIVAFKTYVKKAGVEEEAQDIFSYAKDTESEKLLNINKLDTEEQKDGAINIIEEKIIDDGKDGKN